MPNPLIVFAHADEAQAFSDVSHLVTGIGKINAVAELARRLGEGDVSEVVVLGTAGMLDDHLDLDTVYRVAAAVQHDFEFPTDAATLPGDGVVEMLDPLEWEARGAQVMQTIAESDESPTAVIATGDVFVKDDLLRTTLVARGAQLVDMESYAYAVLCRVYGVPVSIYKIPSDTADSATTHESWDDIVARKSTQLREFADQRGLLIN